MAYEEVHEGPLVMGAEWEAPVIGIRWEVDEMVIPWTLKQPQVSPHSGL